MTHKRLLIHAVFLMLAPIIAEWFGRPVFAASLDLLSNIGGRGGAGGGLPGSRGLCLRAVQEGTITVVAGRTAKRLGVT